MYESSKESKSKNSLHHDVNQRIQELGWEDDDETELDHSKRTVTPISLLPTFHLDDAEFKQKDDAAPVQTARDKIRRNIRNDVISNTQGNSNRRRIISVHILSFFSIRLVDLLDDIHVYNLAKEIYVFS